MIRDEFNTKHMKDCHFASIAALAALSTVMVDAGGSQAAIFTVGGQDYDVTTFTATYNGNTDKFNTPVNGGVMPWWGNPTLAAKFATTIAGNLGFPNPTPPGNRSPYFAYNLDDGLGLVSWHSWRVDTASLYSLSSPKSSTRSWAQATLVPPSSVPGPLPILGAAAAFGMSRRLRRRIASQPYKL